MHDSQAVKKDFIFFLKEKLGFTDIEIYTNPNIVIKNKDKILPAQMSIVKYANKELENLENNLSSNQ